MLKYFLSFVLCSLPFPTTHNPKEWLNSYFFYAKILFGFCPRLNTYFLYAKIFFEFCPMLKSYFLYAKIFFESCPMYPSFPTTQIPKKLFLIC